MRHSPAVLATVVLAVSTTASAQQIIGVREARALRADSVFQRFDRTDSPGCSLGVYQDGKILYARGYGMASLEHGVALSPRSVLDVGSISKQFTAMSILMLQRGASSRSTTRYGNTSPRCRRTRTGSRSAVRSVRRAACATSTS
jgi:Beta-lactamase